MKQWTEPSGLSCPRASMCPCAVCPSDAVRCRQQMLKRIEVCESCITSWFPTCSTAHTITPQHRHAAQSTTVSRALRLRGEQATTKERTSPIYRQASILRQGLLVHQPEQSDPSCMPVRCHTVSWGQDLRSSPSPPSEIDLQDHSHCHCRCKFDHGCHRHSALSQVLFRAARYQACHLVQPRRVGSHGYFLSGISHQGHRRWFPVLPKCRCETHVAAMHH